MSRISLELVPRSREGLSNEIDRVRRRFPQLDTLNLPDLERFPVRSWEACALASDRFERTLPHIRAMDVALPELDRWIERFEALGLNELIVVRGDPPDKPGRLVHPTRSAELIAALRRAAPHLRLFAALDPYRDRARDVLRDIAEKREAGADGFFTQPFFDLRFMAMWGDQLDGCEVYWGLSPVTRVASRRYWETRNGVVFPAGFESTLEANQRFAKEALAWADARDDGVYFMPIREDPIEYLAAILEPQPDDRSSPPSR